MLEPAVLAATLEAVSDAVLITGPDGAICWTNAAFTAMTGYTPDEVAGKTPRLLKSGAQDAAFYGELWSTILSGRAWSGEMTNRRKDGSIYMERQTITPVKDAGGAITHFIAVKREITGERRLGALHENVPLPYQSMDASGRLIEVNQAWLELLGYERRQVEGRPFADFLAPGQSALFEQRFAAFKAAGRTCDAEFDMVRRNGSPVRVSLCGIAARKPDGTFRQSYCILHDISERQRAREEREAILDTALDGFVVVDGDGRILETNEAYCRMSGYRRDELLRMRVHDLEAAETPEAVDAHRARIAHIGFDRFESRHRRKDGAIVDLDICLNYLPAAGNVFAFLRDITERKRTERALRESEANYRNLVEQMPEGCAVHELAGTGETAEYRFLAVNPAFERLTGLSAKAVTGRSLREALPEMEREWAEIYERVALTGKPVHFERYFPALGKHLETIAWRPDERRFAMILADVTEQRETAERLRESEARYRDMVETAWEGVWQIDAEHRTMFVNRRMAEMVGYSREEMAGRPVTYFVDEDVADLRARGSGAHSRRTFGTPGLQTSPQGRLPSSGSCSRPCRAYDAAGRYTGAIAMVADITERRQAERELQFERAQLLSIFDAIEDPVYVSDPRTHEVLFVNRSPARGARPRPRGGKCYRELQGKDRPCDFCTNPVIFGDGGKSYRWRFDNPVLGRTYDVTDQVIRWPDGRDVRLEFASDVTEGVRAEARLRDAHHLLDTLVQAAPVAIVALDAERRVRMWNRCAELISGWRAEEVDGPAARGARAIREGRRHRSACSREKPCRDRVHHHSPRRFRLPCQRLRRAASRRRRPRRRPGHHRHRHERPQAPGSTTAPGPETRGRGPAGRRRGA